MKTYVTASKDTWDLISWRVYGREDQMHRLIEANYEHRKTVFFRSGVVLNVPEFDVATTVSDVELPPWKRKK